MKKTNVLLGSAMAVALSLTLQAGAQGGPAPVPKFDHEKCFGISKAGKNDCQTANSSCAGTSKRNAQGDAWVYLPKGSCEKVVGGSLQPKQG
ncbi:MAG: signal peptidase [Candidatus Rokuibacteriota bacterium]|nr:MAG: signal peptidase [Candidatus Rokubacteria bacterium]